MRIAMRKLCSFLLMWGALACGDAGPEPCSQADAAAGRCEAQSGAAATPPSAAILPDWALRLCDDWRRHDGSCELMEIKADYEECLAEKGVPEQERMLAQGVGNRAVQRARERATHLCLEQRRWSMTPEARKAWLGLPERTPRSP